MYLAPELRQVKKLNEDIMQIVGDLGALGGSMPVSDEKPSIESSRRSTALPE